MTDEPGSVDDRWPLLFSPGTDEPPPGAHAPGPLRRGRPPMPKFLDSPEKVEEALNFFGPEGRLLHATAAQALLELEVSVVMAEHRHEGELSAECRDADATASVCPVFRVLADQVAERAYSEGVGPGSPLAEQFPLEASAYYEALKDLVDWQMGFLEEFFDQRAREHGFITREEAERQLDEAYREGLEQGERERQALAEKEKEGGRRRRAPRGKVPMPTFAEAKAIALALADGRTMRHWFEVEGEVALRHVPKDSALLQVKLSGASFSEWMGLPLTTAGLKGILQQGGVPAILVQLVCVQLAIETPRPEMYLDDLIGLMGWKPRTVEEREELRAKIWRSMLLSESLHVIGDRGGVYHDPITKERLSLATRDPLIRIVGQELPVQQAFDQAAVPLKVSWVAGVWIERFRGNRGILTDFGDLCKLTAIPHGKPTGAWAQAMGLTLQQIWREQSSYAKVNMVGDTHKATVKYAGITMRRLLTTYEPEPSLTKFIEQDNPKLVRQHAEGALKLLKERGVVGHYDAPPTGMARQGWLDAYLDYQRDIRPSREALKDSVEINRRATVARKRARSRRPRAATAAAST
jgi:hypothetical protein